ncbi:hypothetical protein [Vibrio sp. B1FIG11]|uniref:hypothetical protein n=1 Tax=Vibrio sp. B1FIG11 TaxID=2751177 RepID=UPI001BAFEA5C|nr:hypothetical protein [Vibrio sp. B1FIG11]
MSAVLLNKLHYKSNIAAFQSGGFVMSNFAKKSALVCVLAFSSSVSASEQTFTWGGVIPFLSGKLSEGLHVDHTNESRHYKLESMTISNHRQVKIFVVNNI